MQKWLIVLALALLLNSTCARAEENIYFTSNSDRYYHLDANCDCPPETNWWNDVEVQYYQRQIYHKKPISEVAALEFDKTACPICVQDFKPLYIGKYMPDWNYEAAPWEINGLTPEQEAEFDRMKTAEYRHEIAATADAFNAYFEQVYNRETGLHEQKNAYPDAYAGKYMNNSGCVSYRIVDPDADILSAFERMFGGGAWIVPAKYGYDEIYAERERIFQELIAWCEAHPQLDARPVSAVGPDYENCAVIGISGADWQQAAAAMEQTAPVYIHFTYDEPYVALDSK